MDNFAFAIKTAILLFPVVALFFTLPYILSMYHKYGSISSYRSVLVYSLILYMMCAYFLVILPLPSKEYVMKMTTRGVNLQPFLFIKKIFNDTPFVVSDFKTYFPTLKYAVVYEAIFNVFLTVPFGVYLHYYFKFSFKKTLLFSFLLTLFFELTQLSGLYFIYPKSYRFFDVDDLILNTTGGVIGYFIASLFAIILPSRDLIDVKSYVKGKSISLFRRIISILVDAIVLLVLCFAFGFIIYVTKLTKVLMFIPFIIYLVLVLIFKRTLGMSLTSLRYVSKSEKKVSRFRILSYYVLFFLEYFFFTVAFVLVTYYLYKKGFITRVQSEYTLIIIFAFTLMVYVISFLKRCFKLSLMFENVSMIELKSTILEDEKDCM